MIRREREPLGRRMERTATARRAPVAIVVGAEAARASTLGWRERVRTRRAAELRGAPIVPRRAACLRRSLSIRFDMYP
ncbi:hypothetical protein [Burkholderia pseudomallei]|uniref:hypothetical protein n=1 Tax=Burkholderia pseudomallei TaxID=28450 RepID=UPI00287F7E79|nr:hypothetical protein [Burkholderia pseudomallei]